MVEIKVTDKKIILQGVEDRSRKSQMCLLFQGSADHLYNRPLMWVFAGYLVRIAGRAGWPRQSQDKRPGDATNEEDWAGEVIPHKVEEGSVNLVRHQYVLKRQLQTDDMLIRCCNNCLLLLFAVQPVWTTGHDINWLNMTYKATFESQTCAWFFNIPQNISASRFQLFAFDWKHWCHVSPTPLPQYLPWNTPEWETCPTFWGGWKRWSTCDETGRGWWGFCEPCWWSRPLLVERWRPLQDHGFLPQDCELLQFGTEAVSHSPLRPKCKW